MYNVWSYHLQLQLVRSLLYFSPSVRKFFGGDWYLKIFSLFDNNFFQIFSPEILGGHGGEAGFETEGENVLTYPDVDHRTFNFAQNT